MAAYAQDNPQVDPQVDLATVDCRTLLQMPEDEREYTMILYHGYITGRNNETTVDGNVLAEVTDQVIDYCIDNPDNTLLSGFEQFRPAP